MHQQNKFIEIGRPIEVYEIMHFFVFHGRHLGFLIIKFYWLTGSGGQRCIILPNLIKIGHSIKEIVISRFFKMAAVRHLGYVWGAFGPPTNGTWWSLSMCKIWL